ncbi:MAG: MFS transporter [Aggregatilineales bacterium]
MTTATARTARQRFSGLWRHPEFMKLWIGQTISALGAHFTGYGLPLTALLIFGATPAQMGLLTAISSLPALIFGLAAGAWVDRLRRRPLMVAADLGRMLLLSAIPLAALTGHLSMALLIIVAALTNTLSLVFDVAYRAFLPVLISREHVLEGNSKLATTESLAEIGGPALVGALIQLITAPLAIAFDALSFLFSAISLSLIHVREDRPTREPIGEAHQSIWYEIRAGIRLVSGHPLLQTMAIIAGARSFFGNFFGTLYSLYAIRDLGLTPIMLGVLIGAGGVGALIGATLAQPLVRRFGLGRTLTGPLLIGGVIGLLTPLAGGPVAVAAAMMMTAQLVNDCAMTVYGINELSTRQTIVPDEWLGRANATIGFIAQAVAPISALTAGLLASTLGDRLTLGVAVIGGLGIALWAWRSPLRTAQLGIQRE